MRFRSRILAAVALAVGLSFASMGSGNATATVDGVTNQTRPSATVDTSNTVKVAGRYRRRGYRRYRRRRGRGFRRGVAIGVGAAIVGAIILNQAAQARRRPPPPEDVYVDDAFEACAARYRSFRYSDGTFQPYGYGPRRLCPYLR